MTIKNEDLNLLIQIENFLGTNFPRGSEGQDLAWKLCSLNEKLIMQRNEQRGKTASAIKERRKENPDYAECLLTSFDEMLELLYETKTKIKKYSKK